MTDHSNADAPRDARDSFAVYRPVQLLSERDQPDAAVRQAVNDALLGVQHPDPDVRALDVVPLREFALSIGCSREVALRRAIHERRAIFKGNRYYVLRDGLTLEDRDERRRIAVEERV